MSGGNINVVVRCRPLNSRELARGAQCLIRMEGNQTIITKPADYKNSRDTEDVKAFTFDKSYWSADKSDPTYADQDTVYNDLGVDLLNHAFDGYNCCIFAYGQTGSGKSYSMMGYGDDIGITPKTCSELFVRIAANKQPNLTYSVEVSYIEIYNEKVHDLLNPKNKGNLKVREHPSLGPYVEDLSRLVVRSYEDINHLMDEGNKARTIAATNMNETSSRSHAVFTVFLTQTRTDEATSLKTEKVARISLVDLAGSERANSTGATGARLKEGANINKSLTTLGKVISGLADQSIAEQSKKSGKKTKEVFIPYRDSVLTWLLKDSLGGNSKTAMIAAISPADYDETLSTLRYADQAKKITNKAIVNEDPNAKLIRELKEELSTLRDRLMVYAPEVVEELAANSTFKPPQNNNSSMPMPTQSTITNANQVLVFEDASGVKKKMTKQEVVDQLQTSEKLLANLNETWEEKLKRTQSIHLEREKALKDLGITIDKNDLGVYMPKAIPFIVNLNEDPLMSECLMYQIKAGKTRVGRQDGKSGCEIRLSGSNIMDEHCYFEHENNTVTVYPHHPEALTMVNGIRIKEPTRLKNGYRIILGHHHIFRFNHPEEVRKERFRATSLMSVDTTHEDTHEVMDWNYARLEAMKNHYSSETNFSGLKDEELEKLYDDLGRIRLSRKSRADSRTGSRAGSRADSRADSRAGSRMDDDDESVYNRRLSAAVTVVDDNSSYTESSTRNSFTTEKIQEQLKDEQVKHRKQMDLQRSFYEAKLTRMSSMQLWDVHSANQITVYTPAEKQLVQKVVHHWQQLHSVTMAEVGLTHAVLLKEANIISKELTKEVLYQFTVVEDRFSQMRSHWEEYEDQDDCLINIPKPCIGIRVIDKKHMCVYLWSLDKLKTRLHKMRNLRNIADKPQRKHFNTEDPFYEIPAPKYSFIGSAAVSFRNLTSQQQAYESCVEILCRTTGQVKGKLKLLVSPIALAGRSTPATNTTNTTASDIAEHNLRDVIVDSHDLRDLQIGQHLLFEIRLLELIGLQEKEFSQVHVQFRLSSFGGIAAHCAAEKLFATDPVSGFEDSPISLDYSQTLSMVVTERMKDILLNKMISFEIYGIAQLRTLSQYERWDDQREKPHLAEMLAENQKKIIPAPVYKHRPEEELMSAERHDILAWIQICELMPNGEYMPVNVSSQSPADRGLFHLRQGLQRRIRITLSHTSGRQFAWNKISKAIIGQVRLLDAKGRIISSPSHEDIVIRLLPQQQVHYKNDGTSQLVAQGPWDSSQHDCLFLNRFTLANTRILLNLKWEIEAEKCSKPIQCNMDIAVRIQGRDASTTFGLRKLLGTCKYLTKCSGLFLLHLRPPMTRRVSQLWRLNTATKYVQGEESLGSWRPRGVSLITDFKHIQDRIARKEQVARTAQILMLHSAKSQTSLGSMNENKEMSCNHKITSKDSSDCLGPDKVELLRKVLSLWCSKWGTDKEIILTQDPPIPGMQDFELQKEAWNTYKLISEVKLVTEFDHVSKKGYLNYQENALDDKWSKKFFVLRRPYVYIYSNQSETDEIGIINLSTVRVDYNRALEMMIQRNNVFSLYTNNNAYILQANSKSEMIDWMKCIGALNSMEK